MKSLIFFVVNFLCWVPMAQAQHDYSIQTDYYDSRLAKDPKWRSEHLVLVRSENEYMERMEIIPWMRSIDDHIAARKTYQSFAKSLEVQKTKPIVVCYSVDESGVISNAHIWQSSRNHPLDRRAIKLVGENCKQACDCPAVSFRIICR